MLTKQTTGQDFEDLLEAGRRFEAEGNLRNAKTCFARAATMRPESFAAFYNLGIVAERMAEYELIAQAMENALRLITVESGYFSVVLNKLGMAYYNMQNAERAVGIFGEAVRLFPDDFAVNFGLAISCEEVSDIQGAADAYKKCLEINSEAAVVYYRLSNIVGKMGDKKEKLKKQLEYVIGGKSEGLNESGAFCNEMSLLEFAKGNMLADEKRYDEAFETYKSANDYRAKVTKFDSAMLDFVRKSYKDIFDGEFFAKDRKCEGSGTEPVFILGMPRSGTTLTENILTSHSMVESVGETRYLDDVLSGLQIGGKQFPFFAEQLGDDALNNIAAHYINENVKNPASTKLLANKTPSNFINLGFLCKVFPSAKIINCRRHPLDICLSVYFITFSDDNLSYSYNFEDMAAFYKGYEDLVAHWKSTIPCPVYDSYYEELVYGQEEKSRELIDFCGLEWDDSCLDFYKKKTGVFTASKWQVNRPIYTSSVYRYKNYEKHLGYLKEMLKDEIAEYEDEISKRVG